MTPREHYEAAEAILSEHYDKDDTREYIALRLQEAQVHATLATFPNA